MITSGPADIAIDDRGIICSWPPEAAQLFGHERQRALGNSIGELIIPPRLRDSGFLPTLPLDTPFDVPVVHQDGRELRVALTVRRDGTGLISRFQELSERTPPDLELVLRAATDSDLEERHRLLTELSQLRTEFIRVASHELRTPLTSIVTFATMLESGDETLPMTAADRQAALGVIRRNAERMQLLVADLLLLSHLETADTPLDIIRVDLAGVLGLLGFPGIRVAVGPGPDPRADEPLLRQLLHTAVGVATVAHEGGGPVSVDASHADGRWTIRVHADTSATVTAERLLSMRIPHPEHPGEHRTGALALMLGREIAARHGGAMVTSVDRSGVTVRITLPDS